MQQNAMRTCKFNGSKIADLSAPAALHDRDIADVFFRMLWRPSQLWGKRVCCPTASCPTARSCKKRLSFAACPAAAGSNQHKAGRQARYGLAELPRLPYIVNLGVTTELPTDHKALPNFHHLPFKGWGPRGQCFPPGSCGPSSSFPPGPRERGKERERQMRLRQKQTCVPLLDACLPLIIGTSQCTQYRCRKAELPRLLDYLCTSLPPPTICSR
jgi:hypothetical protein